jgi:hypothetical protein
MLDQKPIQFLIHGVPGSLLVAVRWPGLEARQLLSIYHLRYSTWVKMHGAVPSAFHMSWCDAEQNIGTKFYYNIVLYLLYDILYYIILCCTALCYKNPICMETKHTTRPSQ